jgi:quinol-cytochrome oxidoreductase complex cytochrome b subunit
MITFAPYSLHFANYYDSEQTRENGNFSFITRTKITSVKEVTPVKRFIIFSISFILLFSLFQILSGMLLTLMYTPDMEEAWNFSGNLSQEVVIQSSHSPFSLTLFIAFLAASIAYFIPKKFKNSSNRTQ